MPREKIVSCCKSKDKDTLFLVSKKGNFFKLQVEEIYNSYNSKLGYVNEKIQIKNDNFFKILPSNHYIDIETNKNKSARLEFNKLSAYGNKRMIKVDFLELQKDEYLENCFRLENFID